MKTSIFLTVHKDPTKNDYGYQFVLTTESGSWTAYRTVKGFRYFMKHYGLEIDTATVNTFNSTRWGRGITCKMKPHAVAECYFWTLNEIPTGAESLIALCNGSYVNCYTHHEEGKTTIYRPNPNAKDVYIPYDHDAVSHQIYGELRRYRR